MGTSTFIIAEAWSAGLLTAEAWVTRVFSRLTLASNLQLCAFLALIVLSIRAGSVSRVSFVHVTFVVVRYPDPFGWLAVPLIPLISLINFERAASERIGSSKPLWQV